MKFAVCTLFEKHYHFGVAVLVNSLVKKGFKGDIYVGYRGDLPQWTDMAVSNTSLNWNGASTLEVNGDVKLHFLPVEIDYQFTNYKPYFMLELFAGICSDCEGVAYFDPDIVVKATWKFFETWMGHGVALVHEIISNDMPPNHPIRKEWEKVIQKSGRTTTRNMYSYINAGFFAVSKKHIEFVQIYKEMIELGRSHFNLEPTNFQFTASREDLFFAKDQDALNIAAMCSESPLSEMGPEGMDFIHGGFTMSHAVGGAKPWKKNFISSALSGISPTLADKNFWANVYGPIKPYSNGQIKIKKIAIATSSLISRFYVKN